MNRYPRYTCPLLACFLAVLAGCQQQPAAQIQLTTAQQESGASAAAEPASGAAGQVDEASASDASAVDSHATPADVAVHESEHRSNAADALAALLEGNRRFVKGSSIHPHESADYRASLAHEQHPFATVLTCSDSRVTPVLIFDQGIGDLFVIRVAGNIVDEDVAGSIEYAVDHLHAPLLVILGHENCGAVTAAYHWFAAQDLREREPHEIESLLMHIEPAVRDLDRSKSESEQITAAVEANVREAIQQLLRIPDMRQAHAAGKVRVVGAVYSVATGEVRIMDH